MSFCILIPTINQKESLVQAIQCYKSHYPRTKIIILDNGNQDLPIKIDYNINILYPPDNKNLGVAGSWNYLIKYAKETLHEENYLILNDDIILKKDEPTINALIEKWGKNTFHRPRPFYNWSAFILNSYIFNKVGDFDTNFAKCFFEDNDYEYRMRLSQVTIRYSDELNAEVYQNSQTIKKNPELGGFMENREYYIKKWGGIPENEKFTKPFNK